MRVVYFRRVFIYFIPW